MRICKRKSFVLCHVFSCPYMWEVLYISIFLNKLSNCHTWFSPTHIIPLWHIWDFLWRTFFSILLDLLGIFEHYFILESFLTCSLHFSPTSLWLFSILWGSAFCLFYCQHFSRFFLSQSFFLCICFWLTIFTFAVTINSEIAGTASICHVPIAVSEVSIP